MTPGDDMHALETILARVRQEKAEVETERDAMAAHVKWYLAAYTKLTNAEQTEDADTREIMYLANQELMAEFDAIAGEVPDESLTRLIAKKQAEVLTQASIDTMTAAEAATVRAHLRNRARKFRRQAEGDPS